MCGQHLAVRVDVDAFSGGLLEQELEVVQVVPGDDDEGSLFNGQRDDGGNGVAVGFGIGAVEQGHTAEVVFPDFEDDGQELLHVEILADGEQRTGKEAVQFFVLIAEDHCVVRVGGHAADTEKNERFEAADILVRGPKLAHVIVGIASAGTAAGGAAGDKAVVLGVDTGDKIADRGGVEVDVGDGGEQAVDDEAPRVRVGVRVTVGCAGKTDERTGQFVLELGDLGTLAADAGCAGAAGAMGGLLTLITKHLLIHGRFLLCIKSFLACRKSITGRHGK